MADLNYNGIDDADEVEHIRKVTNADGSSETNTFWKKNRPPAAMAGQVDWGNIGPNPTPNPLPARPPKNYGPPLETNPLKIWLTPENTLPMTTAIGRKLGEWSVPAQEYMPQTLGRMGSAPVAPAPSPVVPETVAQMPLPNETPWTPALNQAVGAVQAGGGVSALPQMAPPVTPSPVPAVMRQPQLSAWDKYEEQNRQIRLAMGIGGIAGNARTDAERLQMQTAKGRFEGTMQSRKAAEKALEDLAAGRIAQEQGVTAQAVANAQEIALQEAKNKGIAAGVRPLPPRPAIALKGGGFYDPDTGAYQGANKQTWNPAVDSQGNRIPNTWVDQNGKPLTVTQNNQMQAMIDAELAGNTGAPQAPQTGATALAVGTIKGGYKFKGGDPTKQENWEKI